MRIFCICMCVLAAVTGPPAASASGIAFVTTTDFISGSASTVDLLSPYGTSLNVASVHSDAVARVYDDLVYVVNRDGADNIQILDPGSGFSTVHQFSMGVASGPHDIVVVSPTKAYVTRYNETALWIVDPSAGTMTGSIDLSAWADADGIPEMDGMARVGHHVFVTIQRLDRNNFFTPVGTSYVAVIDVAADTLVDVDLVTPGIQSIVLTGTNPFSSLEYPYEGRMYVSSVNFFGLQDGGCEFIDPVALQSTGYFVTETTMGGDILDVEIVSHNKGYVIVSDASFNTILKAFDPQTGLSLGTVFNPGGYVLNDIEESPIGGELFLTDRTPTAPGIRIFDVASDTQITGSPISTDLPPFDIAFSVPIQTGVPESPEAVASLGQNYPNPFNPVTTVPFSLARAERVRLRVYDTAGRFVRLLLDEARDAGPATVVWNGRDAAGREVPSGVYFVRLETGNYAETRKLVLLK